jgi:putative oxidoreductase
MSPSFSPARFAPFLQSALRIAAALTFIPHGMQKLLAFPLAEPRPAAALMSQMGLAGMLELFGGLLMLLGLFTRPVAFVLAGEMAVAYYLAHFPRGPWPILNGGELAVLYCFIWLYFFAAGAGPWSLDALVRRKR